MQVEPKKPLSDFDIIIPFKDLRNVIDDCFDHMKSLIKTAKHLHHNNDYPMSIFMIITAFEEVGKLVSYSNFYHKKEGIPRKEIRLLNSHSYKLTKIIKDAETEANRLTEKEYSVSEKSIKLESKLPSKSLKKLRSGIIHNKKILLSLNFVKQLALYYDFREGRSLTLVKQVAKHNLGHLSLYLLEFVAYMINYQWVLFHYRYDFYTIPNEYNIVTDDTRWQECEKYYQRIQSEEYKATKIKSQMILDELNRLYEELERRDLLIK